MNRIAQLDGVRGVAILMVLVWHYYVGQIGEMETDRASAVWWSLRALSLTRSGVDLFFVLSGFLIAGILLDNRQATNFLRVFYIRRVCRIFPLYFLLLGLFLILAAMPLANSPAGQWLFQHPLPLWSYATFTQNIFMGARGDYGPNWLAVTWSLAIEEQFYLIVPLLILLLPRRALGWVLVIAIVGAPILRWLWPGFVAYVNTPWRADSLLSGALLAVLVRWPPFVDAVRAHRRRVVGVFFVLLLGAAVLTVRPAIVGPFKHFWLAGLYATFVLIAFVGSSPFLGRVLGSQPLVLLGQLSYGIYMFHQPVSGLLHGWFRQSAPQLRSLSDAVTTLVALGLTLALAWLSFQFFESPLLRWGHRFRYQQRSRQDAALHAVPSGA